MIKTVQGYVEFLLLPNRLISWSTIGIYYIQIIFSIFVLQKKWCMDKIWTKCPPIQIIIYFYLYLRTQVLIELRYYQIKELKEISIQIVKMNIGMCKMNIGNKLIKNKK